MIDSCFYYKLFIAYHKSHELSQKNTLYFPAPVFFLPFYRAPIEFNHKLLESAQMILQPKII